MTAAPSSSGPTMADVRRRLQAITDRLAATAEVSAGHARAAAEARPTETGGKGAGAPQRP